MSAELAFSIILLTALVILIWLMLYSAYIDWRYLHDRDRENEENRNSSRN